MDHRQRYTLALTRFFNDNPHWATQANDVTAAEANALGASIEELVEINRQKIFAKVARNLGIDVHELVIRLVAESPEQAHQWRLESQRRSADAIGMEWDEFKKLNGIQE